MKKFAYIFLATTMLGSASAHAGFEWVPPTQVKHAAPPRGDVMPPPLPAPLAPVDAQPVGKAPGMQSLSLERSADEGGVLIRRKNREAEMRAHNNSGGMNAITLQKAGDPTPPPEIDNVSDPVPMPEEAGMNAPPLPMPPSGEPVNILDMPVDNVATGNNVYIEPVVRQPIAQSGPLVDASVLEGFGRDVPLALALQQIVPPGFAYALAPNVNAGVSLSWAGGQSWIAELNRALSTHGYQASVRGRTVLINAPSSIAPFPATPISDTEFNRAPETAMPVAQVKAGDLGLHQVWQARPGDSLRRLLADWSAMAGVMLYWPEGTDYVLTQPVRVEGSYTEAVDEVLNTLARLTPHPMARLHTNSSTGTPVLAVTEG